MRKADGSTGRIKALKHTCTHTHGYTTACIFNILPAALGALWFRCTVVNPKTSHSVAYSTARCWQFKLKWNPNFTKESAHIALSRGMNHFLLLTLVLCFLLHGWKGYVVSEVCLGWPRSAASIKKRTVQVISEAVTTCPVGSGGWKAPVLSTIIEAFNFFVAGGCNHLPLCEFQYPAPSAMTTSTHIKERKVMKLDPLLSWKCWVQELSKTQQVLKLNKRKISSIGN